MCVAAQPSGVTPHESQAPPPPPFGSLPPGQLESQRELELRCKQVAIDELSKAHRALRARALRLRPSAVVDIMVAATALDLDLMREPEMAWLAEFVLSADCTLAAGWVEDRGDGLADDGVVGTRFKNAVSGGKVRDAHPFRVEVHAMRAAVDARAAELLQQEEATASQGL